MVLETFNGAKQIHYLQINCCKKNKTKKNKTQAPTYCIKTIFIDSFKSLYITQMTDTEAVSESGVNTGSE